MIIPSLQIRNHTLALPIFQGGMGIGISLSPLAGSVARRDCAGTISSAGIDRMQSQLLRHELKIKEAMELAVQQAIAISENKGLVGVNIMRFIDRDYAESIAGSICGGAHFIASGAGLPLSLPKIVGNADIALIPIVSSLRALKNICKRWERDGRRPDAAIVEGPEAGGHLGFNFEDLFKPEYQLEEIFNPIKEYAIANGNFPIIVAGGIQIDEIPQWIMRGADGVQMGTRYLLSKESTANNSFKQAAVSCKKSDIVIAMPAICPPGSPSGMPFRIIKQSPMFAQDPQKTKCKGYVMQKDSRGEHTLCKALDDPHNAFCICNGLLAATNYPSKALPLWTVGARAGEINDILSVDDITDQIIESFRNCS